MPTKVGIHALPSCVQSSRGQLGAYGGCLRTAFNGFDRAHLVEVRDVPLRQTSDCVLAPARLAA